jgi:hypothetical protein
MVMVMLYYNSAVAVSVPTDVVFAAAPIDSVAYLKYIDPLPAPGFQTPVGTLNGQPY